MSHSIQILRLSIMALQERIEQELQENLALSLDRPAAAWDGLSEKIVGPLICEPILTDNEVERAIHGRYLPLNYKPASEDNINASTNDDSFNNDSNAPCVAPDIIVEKNREGEYEVDVVDDWIPNLFLSGAHLEMLMSQTCDTKASEFLRRKIQAAKSLIEAIGQRRDTLLKVTRAIVQHQRAFLDKGPEYLKPLAVQQIAEEAEVHASIVACALENKWIATPHGTFALQRFFAERIK